MFEFNAVYKGDGVRAEVQDPHVLAQASEPRLSTERGRKVGAGPDRREQAGDYFSRGVRGLRVNFSK